MLCGDWRRNARLCGCLGIINCLAIYKKENDMAITTFAAIYIGSYEVSLKIFELSGKKYLLCRPIAVSEEAYA